VLKSGDDLLASFFNPKNLDRKLHRAATAGFIAPPLHWFLPSIIRSKRVGSSGVKRMEVIGPMQAWGRTKPITSIILIVEDESLIEDYWKNTSCISVPCFDQRAVHREVDCSTTAASPSAAPAPPKGTYEGSALTVTPYAGA
jgi:hypothetical protein